jgi:anti-sigma factor RsiW
LSAGEELLAYLDGELDAESRRRFEEQLSTSGELRQRLKEHQQTWDLLDELPRANVDDSFTRTTVEMVAIHAGDAADQAERTKRWRQQLAWTLVALSTAAAGVFGFFLTSRQLAEPNDRLVKDLPILENLDAFKNAGSVEFLRHVSCFRHRQ